MYSTRGRYAIRVMIDLAQNDNGSYIPLKDVAERQQLSRKYLEIIARDLVAGGLITGTSGKHGGYRLSRKPEEYTIGEILTLMEGTLSSVACLADSSYECSRKGICETLPMWEEFDQLVHDFFYGKRLTDLL
ncbi:MAG: Rrf2 family transcriptional regulator [Lachnospiraceae bacterium]|nr:Rrf2 family transcriptional regulator [Lachnospiraceae bacterium]